MSVAWKEEGAITDMAGVWTTETRRFKWKLTLAWYDYEVWQLEMRMRDDDSLVFRVDVESHDHAEDFIDLVDEGEVGALVRFAEAMRPQMEERQRASGDIRPRIRTEAGSSATEALEAWIEWQQLA